MNLIAVIPARYQSTRFPGKPLVDLGGKPMIQRAYDSARTVFDRVVLAVDDARIYDAARAFCPQADIVKTARPAENGTERIHEVADTLALADDTIIINIQGDQPLAPKIGLEALRKNLTAKPLTSREMATLYVESAHSATNDPDNVKVVVNAKGYALYFSRAAIPHGKAGDMPKAFKKHLGIYAYRVDFVRAYAALAATPLETAESLEQLRALEHGLAIRVLESLDDSPEVDTPESVDSILRILKNGEH